MVTADCAKRSNLSELEQPFHAPLHSQWYRCWTSAWTCPEWRARETTSWTNTVDPWTLELDPAAARLEGEAILPAL